MPVICKDEGMAAFNSFIKILPLQKEQEPILVKYAVLYNENDTTAKSYGTPNIHQNRIRSLLLDRLLKWYLSIIILPCLLAGLFCCEIL